MSPRKPSPRNNYHIKLIGESQLKPAILTEIGVLRVNEAGALYAADSSRRYRKAEVSVPVTPGVWRVYSVTCDQGLGSQNHAILMAHSKAELSSKQLEPMTPVRKGLLKSISGVAGLFLNESDPTAVDTESGTRSERSGKGAFGYLVTRLAGRSSQDTRAVLAMSPSDDGVTASLFDGRQGTARVYTDVDVRQQTANVVALILDNSVSLA